jgi:hypothetical protein
MNFKTTLVLLVLAVAGGTLYWLDSPQTPWTVLSSNPVQPSDSGSLQTLSELSTAKLEQVQILHGGNELVLSLNPSDEWTLPGKWPARKPEVSELIGLLRNLHTRFAPLPAGESELEELALAKPTVTARIKTAKQGHVLAFGEPPAQSNRFSRPTYLRVDDNPEVIRLAPGLLASLARPQDHYQQRRLFTDVERVAKSDDSQDKVELLAAKAVAVKGPTGSYTLTRAGNDWELRDPKVHDRPDPDKLKSVLTAVPDIWAEQFVVKGEKDLAEFGLKDPAQTLAVTRPSGDTVTLLIGKQSQMKTRTVTRPAPNLGGPPMPPQQEVVHEEYRYAKLRDNEQIFEIKADKLKDLFVAAEAMRDARLARFRTDEVRRVELNAPGQEVVLAKEKERWRLLKPLAVDAETSKITELLDKLSGLEARDKDILDAAEAKNQGLDKPVSTVKVTVEQEMKEAKSKKTHVFTFALGKRDADKAKLALRVDNWPRINLVDDSVLKLIERPALAYRGRHVLDFSSSDLAKIEVQRAGGPYTLEQVKGTWKLAAPAQADIDSFKANQLAGDLGRLEVVEFLPDSLAASGASAKFGFDKPVVTAKITFTDAKKPPQALVVGKQRPGKQEYFARLASGNEAFAIRKDMFDSLNQDSLAYLSLQLWQMIPEDVKELRIRKTEPEYVLKQEAGAWKLGGPFEADITPDRVRPMTEEVATLRGERYVALVDKDLAKYGLDKPYLRVAVREAEKVAGTPAPKDRILLIGKSTDKDAKTRYAKLGDRDAIFVAADKLVAAVDHGALDLLNRNLLSLDPRSIERIRTTGSVSLSLQRQGDAWQVTESPIAPFAADGDVLASLLGIWSNLRAQRIAAYGPKVDWAAFGLDKPALRVTVSVAPPAGTPKSAKPAGHTLLIGKPVDSSSGDRFARLDDGPAVLVLAASVAGELTHDYLDLVNHSVLSLDARSVTGLRRQVGGEVLDVIKRDGVWRIVKPTDMPADTPTLEGLVGELASLRAKRVAAYPAKDLKPFGLDAPTAVLTLTGTGSSHVLKVGKNVGDDRFALVDQSTAVVVLPASLIAKLTASPLQFRDRNLARLRDIDRVQMVRGSRKASFAKVDSVWKMTEPLAAETEQTDLEEFLNGVQRLRADELTAEKPADLKPFGLDKPEVRWQFFTGDQLALDLLVGGTEKPKAADAAVTGPRAYAKLATGDVVFLLSGTLTSKALGEYRSRSVWTALDASQVEALSYNQANHSFRLEKVDNDWRATAKPDVKVKQEAVRETLDALAGLRAVRYVEDKGDNLKLYGLEPPQLVVEVQTRDGRRSLQIGRPEGDSKRYYARVAEGNQSPVFVVAEVDAARIVRPLAAFNQDTAKSAPAGP